MIRRILLASASALALAGTAFAADMPMHAPPPVYMAPPPMWTGFYIGVNAGGTWSNSNSVDVVTPTGIIGAASALGVAHALASFAGMNGVLGTNNSGFIGGGQIGYNYQFANSWVAGIEADIQGVAGSQHSASLLNVTTGPGFPANPVTTNITASRSLDYLGTVRGRLGYLVTPTFLIFGDGGLAYGGVNSSVGIFGAETPPAGPNNGQWFTAGKISNTEVGWTAGGGVEWMFLPNWSAKVEYLYYDLGRVTFSDGVASQIFPPATPYWTAFPHSSEHFNGNVVRAGINYHFNWGAPAPVVAKY
jgi:outer membrane immunogenic protein